MSDYVLETSGLTVYYGKQRGIQNVDLAVRKGEVFGFLGPNGAGKTTALRVLLDIIRPNAGQAKIFGRDCQQDGHIIRDRIGYIAGELALPPTMRGRDYLNMLNGIRKRKASDTYRRSLTARFDLDVSRRVKAYSRGNKQKLALVAAFMHKPDLLILDEPTGGLDPLVQQAVLDTVREASDEGRTTFFSSHILPEVQAVCDRIAIIRRGEIIATETVSDLLISKFKRLKLTFGEMVSAEALKMEGVRILNSEGNSHTIEIQRNLAVFMQTAARFGIIDIHTLELSLEEVFLSFYGKSLSEKGDKTHVA